MERTLGHANPNGAALEAHNWYLLTL